MRTLDLAMLKLLVTLRRPVWVEPRRMKLGTNGFRRKMEKEELTVDKMKQTHLSLLLSLSKTFGH